MKKFIIIRIARLIRRKVHVAKNMKLKHINYMYGYNYFKLLKSYYKALTLLATNYSKQLKHKVG